MHYESDGGVVPMLCPGCCTLDDIPDWPEDDTGDLNILVGCHRCAFTFPALPGEFKSLTLHAMHNHECEGPDAGNWDAVGKVIINRLGELQEHNPEQIGRFMQAAFEKPGDDPDISAWQSGNAIHDGRHTRGWLLGRFIDQAHGLRFTRDVEVKWGTHPAGQTRDGWTDGDRGTTLALLVEGAFRIDLTNTSITLGARGDYALWGPGAGHTWEALADSTVLTVRWPS